MFYCLLEHVNNLNKLCRLCGNESKSDRRTDKTQYATELLNFYDIDINKDTHSVHPNSLCQSCRCHLYRLRKENCCQDSSSSQPKLKKRKLFSEHSTYRLCQVCENSTSVGHEMEGSSSGSNMSKLEEILSLFCKLEKHEKLTCIEKILKQFLPQQTFKDHIRKFQQIYPYNNLDSLKNFDAESYLNSFQQDILTVILAITGQQKEMISYQHIFPLMESIYRLSDKEFIGIWSFMQNLVTFSSTKNKQACNILGTAIPGTKYSSISKFLNDIEKSQQATCPEGDIAFMFDNEQVIGRTWNIRAQNKVKMSIITNVAVVKISSNSNLQSIEDYSPKKWLTSENKKEVVLRLCGTDTNGDDPSNQQNIDDHYSELHHHLEHCIAQVVDELHKNKETGELQDVIDENIAEEELLQCMQKCPHPDCNKLVEKKKRKCPYCQTNMSNYRIKNQAANEVIDNEQETPEVECVNLGLTFHMHDKNKSTTSHHVKRNLPQYSHINSCHSENPSEVTLLDPVFVNPNSIQSMILVLRHIGKIANISKYLAKDQLSETSFTKRAWTFVCCDGLPHALVRRLIEEYFICTICKEGFLGIDDAKKHGKKDHPNESSAYYLEFDWVFLLTGEGHYEMNLLKSFMELNWTVFMSSFMNVMGWKSEKAQQSAMRCSDNHKSWQSINVFHFGSMLELVRPFVGKCLSQNTEPSARAFISHAKQESANANFMYIFEMVCKYTQGIINFRTAIRRNNPQLLDSAKWMTKELFHGRNHPKYQEIEIYESFIKKIMPVELQQFMNTFCSISKSGHPSKGQGLDFLLEEENKNVKCWLKRGVPSDQCWLATCRNHQSFKSVKKKVLNLAGIGTTEIVERELHLEDAIKAWRVHLRKLNYLSESNHGPVLTSIDGQILNQGLIDFTSESNRKRGYRVMDMILHEVPPNDPTLHHPVYVAEAEKERFSSVNALSIAEIDNRILDFIENLDANSKQAFLDLFDRLVKVKCNKKEQHIIFLEEVSAAVMQQTVQTDDIDILEDCDHDGADCETDH